MMNVDRLVGLNIGGDYVTKPFMSGKSSPAFTAAARAAKSRKQTTSYMIRDLVT